MYARLWSLALVALAVPAGAFVALPTAAPLGAAALGAAPADDGPARSPWISIELPANPYDASTRDAFLLVHAFDRQAPVGYVVTGTAEGLVRGERKSVTLEFAETSRDGVYALKRTWPTEGTWTLVLQAHQGPDAAATALVELGPDGQIAAVRVPTVARHWGIVPAPVSLGDVDAALRARAATLADRS